LSPAGFSWRERSDQQAIRRAAVDVMPAPFEARAHSPCHGVNRAAIDVTGRGSMIFATVLCTFRSTSSGFQCPFTGFVPPPRQMSAPVSASTMLIPSVLYWRSRSVRFVVFMPQLGYQYGAH